MACDVGSQPTHLTNHLLTLKITIMTRKDFIIVATILAKLDVPESKKQEINVILRGTNPNFNASKFWDYVEKMKNN